MLTFRDGESRRPALERRGTAPRPRRRDVRSTRRPNTDRRSPRAVSARGGSEDASAQRAQWVPFRTPPACRGRPGRSSSRNRPAVEAAAMIPRDNTRAFTGTLRRLHADRNACSARDHGRDHGRGGGPRPRHRDGLRPRHAHHHRGGPSGAGSAARRRFLPRVSCKKAVDAGSGVAFMAGEENAGRLTFVSGANIAAGPAARRLSACRSSPPAISRGLSGGARRGADRAGASARSRRRTRSS